MQGVENIASVKTFGNLLQAAYPNCGYKTETGGRLYNLRNSTSIEKIRAYHKQIYRPENLTLIIAGKVSPDRVFEALKPLQEKIKSIPKVEGFVRPWQTPVDKIQESQDIRVSRKCDDGYFTTSVPVVNRVGEKE